MWPAGSRPGPGLPERGGTAPCLPEGARGPGGRPGPGHAGVRGRAGPRSWTPAPSPGVCAAQGGRTRVVRRGREPPAGGGGTSAARPGGGERLSPGLGGSRCCLGRAVGRGHAAQARDAGAGRGVGGEALPHMALAPTQVRPVEGRSCHGGLWHHWAWCSAQDRTQEGDRAGSLEPWLRALWGAPPELLLRARVCAPVGRAHTPLGLLPAAAVRVEAVASCDTRPARGQRRHCWGQRRAGTRAGPGPWPRSSRSRGDHSPRAARNRGVLR